MLLDLLEPGGDIVEGLLLGDVVDQDDPVRALVVGRGDRLEALLPGRVPDVQLELLVVY